MSVVGAGRGLIDSTDVGAFGVESRIRLRGQPVTDAMGLEVSLFFKKRPTERCDMFGTRPRRMASSAISRWVHWLIGRSLSDGFSHVIATTAQIARACMSVGLPIAGHGEPFTDSALVVRLPPPLAPIPHRFRPHAEFACALAHAYTFDRMHNDAGAKRPLLRGRMGSYQLFQRLALVGQNTHRIGSQ